MNRFFVHGNMPDKNQVVRVSDGDNYNHIVSSLRMKKGESIEIVFEDRLESIAEIIEISKNEIMLKIIKNRNINREFEKEVHLFQGIPKLKKFENIVQKTVECGVHSITPVNMDNCVALIEGKKSLKKQERLQKISLSAAEQSKRLYIPKVYEACSFEEMLKNLGNYDLCILADENLSIDRNPSSLKTITDDILLARNIAIIVGPEGGISISERQKLNDLVKSVSLGARILRTETAAVYILAQLAYIFS